MTCIDCCGVQPLVVMPIPLLCALLHLSCVVGSQGQVLQMMTSGHRIRRDEVIKGQSIQGTERTPRTLYGLIDRLGQRIGRIWIVTGC